MLPGSFAKNKLDEIGKYELIKDVNDDVLITFSEFCQVLYDEVGVEIPELENESEEEEETPDDLLNDDSLNDLLDLIKNENEDENEIMNKELFYALVHGFNHDV